VSLLEQSGRCTNQAERRRYPCTWPGVWPGGHDLAAAVASDRLQRILRESLGASYGVQARAVELADGSAYLDVRTSVENAKLSSALGEIRRLVDDMAARPIDDRTLEWARYTKATSVALSQMSNEAVAASILERSVHGLSPDLAEVKRDLDAVSPKDLQSDFQQCLRGHPTLSVVGEEAVVKLAVREGWR